MADMAVLALVLPTVPLSDFETIRRHCRIADGIPLIRPALRRAADSPRFAGTGGRGCSPLVHRLQILALCVLFVGGALPVCFRSYGKWRIGSATESGQNQQLVAEYSSDDRSLIGQ